MDTYNPLPCDDVADQQRYYRATHQNLRILSEENIGPNRIYYYLLGSTGAKYHIDFNEANSNITCTCPDFVKRKRRCKHIIYLLIHRNRSGLVPLTPALATKDVHTKSVVRKALDTNECPICLDSFTNATDATYCKHGCGNNIHIECITMLKSYNIANNNNTTVCPMCRCVWKFL